MKKLKTAGRPSKSWKPVAQSTKCGLIINGSVCGGGLHDVSSLTHHHLNRMLLKCGRCCNQWNVPVS